MRIQRSGLPLMILAGVALVVAALIVILVANPFARTDRVRTPAPAELPADQSTSQSPEQAPVDEPPPPEPEPELEPATEPELVPEPEPERIAEPDPTPRPEDARGSQEPIPASTYVVRDGDTLFDVAREIWGDPWLWPLILENNEGRIRDPDFLRPGQQLSIPAWVTVESGLTEEQRRRLAQAHVLAYEHYRQLGDDAVGLGAGQPAWWLAQLGRIRLNKAHWVLYSGLRYDESLLRTHGAEIRANDAEQVRAFVERFGLPPNRR